MGRHRAFNVRLLQETASWSVVHARPAGIVERIKGAAMKMLTIGALIVAGLLGSAAANESLMKELAPTGKLRVGVVFAPSKSLFFNVKDGERASGITADIAAALAQKLGVPV